MGDWDDFEAEASAPIQRASCSVGALLASLDDATRRMVERTLDRPEVTTSGIYKALRARLDSVPSAFTLRRHRRKECSCVQQQEGNQ